MNAAVKAAPQKLCKHFKVHESLDTSLCPSRSRKNRTIGDAILYKPDYAPCDAKTCFAQKSVTCLRIQQIAEHCYSQKATEWLSIEKHYMTIVAKVLEKLPQFFSLKSFVPNTTPFYTMSEPSFMLSRSTPSITMPAIASPATCPFLWDYSML